MRKRIIAFYDLLLFSIICSPLILLSSILFFIICSKGTSNWVYENWYIILLFAIAFTVSLSGTFFLRYCLIYNNSIHFHYFPFVKSWKDAFDNIDIKWNQDVLVSEIINIDVVKLSNEEKKH